MKRLGACLMLTFLALAQSPAELEMKKARYRAEVQGDLKGAIADYGKIASKYEKDRAVAARALLEMARCYERQGEAEAKKVYERVVKTYGELKDVVAEAQARLAAIGGVPAPAGAVLARQVYSGRDITADGSVSADGRLLSFSDWSKCRLMVKDLVSGAARELTQGDCDTGAVPGSVISGDGKRVAFGYCRWEQRKRECELRTVGIDGSGARSVAPLPETAWPIPYGWTPDGREILLGWDIAGKSSGEFGRMIAMVDAVSGSVRKVRELPLRYAPGRSRFMLSPDGKWIAYADWVDEGKPHRDVYLIPASGGEPRLVFGGPYDDCPLGFGPDGKVLLAASNRGAEPVAFRVRLENGRPEGEPQVAYTGLPGSTPMGITSSGALLLGGSKVMQTAYEADLDPVAGKIVGAPRILRYQSPMVGTPLCYLPDGKRAVYSSRSGRGDYGKVTVRELESGRDRTIEGFEGGVMCSVHPNGRLVLTSGRRQEPGMPRENGYFLLDVETGAAKLLMDSSKRSGQALQPHIAPDGRWAYFSQAGSGRFHFRRIDIETMQEEDIWQGLPEEVSFAGGAPISPDGKRVAVRRAGYELHVMGVDGTGDFRLFGSKEAKDGVVNTFVWSSDGKWIYFLQLGDEKRKSRILRVSAGGGEAQVVYSGDIMYPFFGLHPSGRRISFIEGSNSSELWALENIARPRAD